MRIPWRRREYERTCDDCGTSWRVPKAIAHPRLEGLPMRGSGMTVVTRADAVVEAADAVVEANAELAERAAAFRRCPKCESDHYKQRSIRS